MNFKRLKHFVSVVEAKNFHRAASSLCITQPALSISIRELEHDMGVRLLDRTPEAVLPTPRGEVLYSHALALLRDAEAARNAVRGLDDSAERILRFGIGKTISTRGLAQAMQNLKHRFPKIRFHAISGTYAGLAPRLRARELDFLLTRLPEKKNDPDFDYQSLFDDPHVVIASTRHPLINTEVIELEDLVAYPWVYGEAFEDVIPNWGATFRAKNLEPPQPTLYADSYRLIRTILVSSDVLSVMPSQMIRDDLNLGRLGQLKPDCLPWAQECGLTLHRHRTPSPVVEHFLKELVTFFRQAEKT